MARKGNENGNTQHIGEAIQKLLASYHIKSRFDEANLISSWERLVGKPVAKRTKRLFMKNQILFVELDSPALKNDLSIHKIKIIEVFQKEFGPEVIRDLVIL